MISVIKDSDSTSFCVGSAVAPVVPSLGCVDIADACGGGGGETTFVLISPASAEVDSTVNNVIAAQSSRIFVIDILL